MGKLSLPLTILTGVLAGWVQGGRALEAGPFLMTVVVIWALCLLDCGIPWLAALCRALGYIVAARRFTPAAILVGLYVFGLGLGPDKNRRWACGLLFLPFAYLFSAPALLAAGWVAWSLHLLIARRFAGAQDGLPAATCLIDALFMIELGRPGLAVSAVGVFCLAVLLPSLERTRTERAIPGRSATASRDERLLP